MVLGEADSGDLLALKRVGGVKGRGRASLAFSAPSEPCHMLISLYLISDCYLGLDQQYELPLHFTADQGHVTSGPRAHDICTEICH